MFFWISAENVRSHQPAANYQTVNSRLLARRQKKHRVGEIARKTRGIQTNTCRIYQYYTDIYTNISILDWDWSGKGVNGEGGSDETTVLRTRYQEKCRKFGADSLRGQCRWFTSPRKTPKQWMDDIEECSCCSYIQLKEMSQDREQWRRDHLLSPTVIDDGRLSEWVSDKQEQQQAGSIASNFTL